MKHCADYEFIGFCFRFHFWIWSIFLITSIGHQSINKIQVEIMIFESELGSFWEHFQLTICLSDKYQSAITFSFDIRPTFNYHRLETTEFVYVNMVIVEEDALDGMKKKNPTLCHNNWRKSFIWNGNRCSIYLRFIHLFQWDWICRYSNH